MWKILRKQLGRILVLVLVVSVFCFTHQISSNLSLGCPDREAKNLLHQLCLLYKNSLVDGNLCSDLCNNGALQYVSCYNYNRGKVVFSATWNGMPVILKSKFGHLSNYSRPHATIMDKWGTSRTVAPDAGLFTSMVYHQVQDAFGFDLKISNDKVLDRMWLSNDNKHSRTSLTDAGMNSLWALLQQEEYIHFTFWNEFRHYPKIYGTCGHFYAVESVPSGFILNPKAISMQEQLASLPWSNRAKIAMSILELVSTLDTEFPEKLHMCDVKHDNYGVTKELLVKAIDVDIAFFQTQLDSTLNQPKCSNDNDCHFFDCKGSCNVDVGKCSSQRSNTNLQAICQDVFSRHYGTLGLLRFPPTPVAKQIEIALQECIEQKGLPSDVKISETQEFQKLYELLEQSVEHVERGRENRMQFN